MVAELPDVDRAAALPRAEAKAGNEPRQGGGAGQFNTEDGHFGHQSVDVLVIYLRPEALEFQLKLGILA